MRLWLFSSFIIKLILQTRMHSHPFGLDVWFLVGPFIYFHTLCVRTAKALARLRRCAGSPEPSLVAYVISTIISWAHIFVFPFPAIYSPGRPIMHCLLSEVFVNISWNTSVKSCWFSSLRPPLLTVKVSFRKRIMYICRSSFTGSSTATNMNLLVFATLYKRNNAETLSRKSLITVRLNMVADYLLWQFCLLNVRLTLYSYFYRTYVVNKDWFNQRWL